MFFVVKFWIREMLGYFPFIWKHWRLLFVSRVRVRTLSWFVWTMSTLTHAEECTLPALSSQVDFIKDVPPVQHGRVNKNGWEMRALDMGQPDLRMDSSQFDFMFVSRVGWNLCLTNPIHVCWEILLHKGCSSGAA